MKRAEITVFVLFLLGLFILSGCQESVGSSFAKCSGYYGSYGEAACNQDKNCEWKKGRCIEGTISCDSKYNIRSSGSYAQAACSQDKNCEWKNDKCKEKESTPKCKEVLTNFNGPRDERINLIFINKNNYGVETFLEKIRKALITNEEDSKFVYSFLSFEPVKSNKDKFNFWYIDVTIKDNSPTNLKNLSRKCGDISDGLKVIIVDEENDEGEDSTAFAINLENYFISKGDRKKGPFFLTMKIPSIDLYGPTLFHEFAHAFGWLSDEYVKKGKSPVIGDYDIQGILNCDIATAEIACPKWCSGPPIDVNEFKKERCEDLSRLTCNNKRLEGDSACVFVVNEDATEGGFCTNIVEFCTSKLTKEECNEAKYTYGTDICGWSEEFHSYYQSHCIPYDQYLNLNIGTQCIEGTGCYNGCVYHTGIFGPHKKSIMKDPGSSQNIPTGNFNERILCERIKQAVGEVAGKCNEIFETVSSFCIDRDNDSFCDWGIIEEKPGTCPSYCKDQIDLDDTDSSISGLTGGTCNDGRPVGECYDLMPLRCIYNAEGNFYAYADDCKVCGCFEGSSCGDDGSCYRKS